MNSQSVVLLAAVVTAVVVGGYLLLQDDGSAPGEGDERAGTVQQSLDDVAEPAQQSESESRQSQEAESEAAETAPDNQTPVEQAAPETAEPQTTEQATQEPEATEQAATEEAAASAANDSEDTTAEEQDATGEEGTAAALASDTRAVQQALKEASNELDNAAAQAETQGAPSEPSSETAGASAELPKAEDRDAAAEAAQAAASQQEQQTAPAASQTEQGEADSAAKSDDTPASEEPKAETVKAETAQSQAADAEPSQPTEETAKSEPAEDQPQEQDPEPTAPALTQEEQTEAEETVVAALPKAPLPDEGETATEEQEEQGEPQTPPPSFDVVRIERDGALVAAGRSPRGSRVFLLRDGKVEAEAEADRRGNWVLILDRPLPPGDHELLLEARLPSGETIRSSELVVASVPRGPTQADEREQASNEQGEGSEEAVAIAVPQEGGGARVLQGQDVEENEGLRTLGLSILSVDYDAEGFIKVAGRGLPGSNVLAYLDNRPIGQTRVAADERWLIAPETAVEEGLYQLRVDQLNEAGEVTARLETVFARTVFIADLPRDRMVVVQPGNSLWRLARRLYGEGILYSVIYEANQDQIRDPDLIYPGQIFVAPPELQAN